METDLSTQLTMARSPTPRHAAQATAVKQSYEKEQAQLPPSKPLRAAPPPDQGRNVDKQA